MSNKSDITRDAESPPNNKYSESNAINTLTKVIDRNIRELRWATYGLAVVGVVIIGRSLQVAKKFLTVQSIPVHFIRRHVKLQGLVQSVNEAGILYVDHTPILKFPKPFLKRTRTPTTSQASQQLLPVHLAGVDVQYVGVSWMKSQLTDKHVWFRLIKLNEAGGLDCIVKYKQSWYSSVTLNKHLIREGHGTFVFVEGLQGDALYQKLALTLAKAELYAERKGRGIWVKPSLWQRVKMWTNNLKDTVYYKTRAKLKREHKEGG